MTCCRYPARERLCYCPFGQELGARGVDGVSVRGPKGVRCVRAEGFPAAFPGARGTGLPVGAEGFPVATFSGVGRAARIAAYRTLVPRPSMAVPEASRLGRGRRPLRQGAARGSVAPAAALERRFLCCCNLNSSVVDVTGVSKDAGRRSRAFTRVRGPGRRSRELSGYEVCIVLPSRTFLE